MTDEQEEVDVVGLMEQLWAEAGEIARNATGLARTNAERNREALDRLRRMVTAQMVTKVIDEAISNARAWRSAVRGRITLEGWCANCGERRLLNVAVADAYNSSEAIQPVMIRLVCSEECWDACLRRAGYPGLNSATMERTVLGNLMREG